jgi:phage pi2 protein 07
MLDRNDIKFFKLAVGLSSIGKESDIDITARCPICGDSSKNKRIKRLHLYEKNGVTNLNCFNGDCACHNKTMYSFLKDFYPSLLEQYKRENFKNTMQKLANGETDDVFSSLKEAKKQKDVIVQDLSPYLKDINESDDAIIYLRNRGIPYYPNKRGKWYFGYQDLKIGETNYKITDSIVIPLYYENEMYGFYSRSIKDKTFCTYMHDANIGYKIWNWFNIDKNQPVYIFEGIFDAISSGLHNIIALMGAKIPDERLKELKNPVFCLDNDKTGLMNSLDYVKKGYSVYIQPDIYKEKDMNELMLKNHVLSIPDLIYNNTFKGISAEVRIKNKL